jgi:hypothetical protein
LRVAGNIPDGKIAEMFGLTQSGFSRIIATQEYKDAETSVLANTITKLDESLAGRADLIRDTYKVAVPAATRALLDAVLQRRDLRASIAAATEILDRDPDRTYTKASRSVSEGEAPAPPPEAVMASAASEASKIAAAMQAAPVDPAKVN